MVIKQILYHPTFIKHLRRLRPLEQNRAIKTEQLFRLDPLHPSLRLHQLKGRLKGIWSISVTSSIRILFTRLPDGTIVFGTIGQHDIYRSL
jgi:mRNA-degrading endonuclease YafQ of YafQ-DinJ toxin-antitoxin module